MGLHQSGVIIERMPRIKFTDGQYRDPHSHEIATACYILWDDGTRGWIHSSFLRAA
jgi:hypothetical protein